MSSYSLSYDSGNPIAYIKSGSGYRTVYIRDMSESALEKEKKSSLEKMKEELKKIEDQKREIEKLSFAFKRKMAFHTKAHPEKPKRSFVPNSKKSGKDEIVYDDPEETEQETEQESEDEQEEQESEVDEDQEEESELEEESHKTCRNCLKGGCDYCGTENCLMNEDCEYA